MDSMVYVWIIIAVAVSVIFLLAGVLNVSGEIPESEQAGRSSKLQSFPTKSLFDVLY